MCSLWLERVETERERLQQLPEQGLQLFALACVDHAFRVNLSLFQELLGEDKPHLVQVTLDELWASLGSGISSLDPTVMMMKVSPIVPDEDSDDDIVPGWTFVLWALVETIKCFSGDDVVESAIRAASCAYSSVAQKEHNAAMECTGTGLGGKEMLNVEIASPLCQKEVAFQLECLHRLERGKPVLRSDLGN